MTSSRLSLGTITTNAKHFNFSLISLLLSPFLCCCLCELDMIRLEGRLIDYQIIHLAIARKNVLLAKNFDGDEGTLYVVVWSVCLENKECISCWVD
jgi:hypothetical protein